MTSALLVIGATGITAQLLLVRELLAVFLGNELALGVVLACWLALEALGSWLAGRLKPRITLFVVVVLASILALPASLWLARIIRPLLGLAPGQIPGLLTVVAVTLLVLSPASLLHGALFTLGVGLNARGLDARPLGRVYVVESAGSVVGGLLLGLLLIGRLSSTQIALLLGIANSLVLLVVSRRAAISAVTGTALLAGSIAALALGLPAAVDRSSLRRLYPGNQVTFSGNSHYGNITILRRAEQHLVLVDGVPEITLPVPDYGLAEGLVHLPMLSHPHPRRVLLVGGGMNGLLSELLKYPEVQIDYCELDPLLVSIVSREIPNAAATGLDDSRVRVRTTDARRYLQLQPDASYDVVIVNVLSPTTLQANRYFSAEFFSLVRRHLRPDGIFALGAPGSVAYLSTDLAELNRLQQNSLQQVFPEVKVIPGEPNLFLATADVRPGEFAPETLAARLVGYGFATRIVTPRYLAERLSSRRAADFRQHVAAAPRGPMINTDQHPIQVLAALSYWSGLTGSSAARWFSGLIRAGVWLVLLFILGLVAALTLWRRRLGFALRFGVFSSGFAGAFTSLLVLLLFQIACGTVYYHLILLTTAFMAGTTLGGAWATRRQPTAIPARRDLYWLESGLALVSPLILVCAPVLAGFGPAGTLAAYLAFALVTGVLLGAEFPLAGRLYLASGRGSPVEKTAATLYAADLSGGVLSSLLAPIILIPVIGMLPAAALVALAKLVSLSMLRFSRA